MRRCAWLVEHIDRRLVAGYASTWGYQAPQGCYLSYPWPSPECGETFSRSGSRSSEGMVINREIVEPD